jgi:predicted MFS family arabinose efflux permease
MPSNRWVVLALLFAVRVSTGIQYQVASLSPQLMSGFVLTIADIGPLIGLYYAPGMILAFPGGAIGAWLGDKPVALIGLALMAIGEIAAATAPTWAVLMIGVSWVDLAVRPQHHREGSAPSQPG